MGDRMDERRREGGRKELVTRKLKGEVQNKAAEAGGREEGRHKGKMGNAERGGK